MVAHREAVRRARTEPGLQASSSAPARGQAVGRQRRPRSPHEATSRCSRGGGGRDAGRGRAAPAVAGRTAELGRGRLPPGGRPVARARHLALRRLLGRPATAAHRDLRAGPPARGTGRPAGDRVRRRCGDGAAGRAPGAAGRRSPREGLVRARRRGLRLDAAVRRPRGLGRAARGPVRPRRSGRLPDRARGPRPTPQVAHGGRRGGRRRGRPGQAGLPRRRGVRHLRRRHRAGRPATTRAARPRRVGRRRGSRAVGGPGWGRAPRHDARRAVGRRRRVPWRGGSPDRDLVQRRDARAVAALPGGAAGHRLPAPPAARGDPGSGPRAARPGDRRDPRGAHVGGRRRARRRQLLAALPDGAGARARPGHRAADGHPGPSRQPGRGGRRLRARGGGGLDRGAARLAPPGSAHLRGGHVAPGAPSAGGHRTRGLRAAQRARRVGDVEPLPGAVEPAGARARPAPARADRRARQPPSAGLGAGLPAPRVLGHRPVVGGEGGPAALPRGRGRLRLRGVPAGRGGPRARDRDAAAPVRRPGQRSDANTSSSSGPPAGRPGSRNHSRPSTGASSGGGIRRRSARVRTPRPPEDWLAWAASAARFASR